ncbi:MAG: UPF0280 family protein [Deltaproteobacteria bacterium]|nr:UPF0280 family protein [Deltaproteobacteria bacterium]
MMYEKRFYRNWIEADDLERFEVAIGESDLFILCNRNLEELATEALGRVRSEIENYIAGHYSFKTALKPIALDGNAPSTVRRMCRAASAWDVGPMAAVAGVVAQFVGRRLSKEAETVIVENGGDIFAVAPRPVKLVLYAGDESPFGDKLAFEVDARQGVGVCTSSGRVGPSLSFGVADAVVAISSDAAFADAAATAIANTIRRPEDIDRAVEKQKQKGLLDGLIACCGDRLGVWGDIELIYK